MSDCGVCIGGYSCDGYPEFCEIRRPKARKEHQCEDCNQIIAVGRQYQRTSGKFDGEFFDFCTCLICVEIRDAFTCSEYDYQAQSPPGELWSDIEEQMFPTITTACYDELHTPEAKSYLRKRWMTWKGLA